MSMFPGVSSLNDKKEYDHLYGKKYRAEHIEAVLKYQYQYRRTLRGWLTLTYSHMHMSSKTRRHDCPNFTKEALWKWVVKQRGWKELFKDWKKSEFSKDHKPSVDRINNNIGYTLNNIRLTTWRRNSLTGYAVRRKPVVQESLTSDFIRLHPGLRAASRNSGVGYANIGRAVHKKQTAGGFRWRYA